jgi:uncharacterized sporulation protein YeaH/YhbH (DUF444 family)
VPIIDRRSNRRDKGSESRKRFIKRHKKYLSGKIDDIVNGKSIKDLGKDGKQVIKGHKDDIQIGSPSKSRSDDPMVIPGNDKYSKGDEIVIPKKGSGQGMGPGDPGNGEGLSEDEFQFVVNTEEFRALLFEGLNIPNLYKKSGEGEEVESLHRAGYTKRGIPGRLHILRTYMQAIGRHMSEGKDPEDEIELDDEDLRYRNLITKTKPITKAVMFCVMDISGSMGEEEKTRAKKFFLLMYLFLTTKYKQIDLVFITYHSSAKEVTEEEFFNTRENGGTQTVKALELVEQIMRERYDLETDNMYMTLVSDGGEFDLEGTFHKTEEMLHDFNYFAYMETVNAFSGGWMVENLYMVYRMLVRKYPHLIGCAQCTNDSGIYPALRELFTGDKK